MATPISGEQPRWTVFSTKLLADLIADQVLQGNTSFSNKAWNFITDEFCKRSGLKFSKEHLKNRFAVLRRQYALIKSILARDDFNFDESSSSIIATDEAWDQYVKEYPDAEAIRTSGCPIYKQLSQIFAQDSMTNGIYETMLPCLDEPVLHPATIECSSEHADDDDAAACPPNPKRTRRSRGVAVDIAKAIFEMAAASKLRTNALKQARSRFSLAECIKELDKVHGLAENVYLEALELFNNPSVRETFLSLKRDMRLAWLRWKCNAKS